jgi:hypothetical protein
MKMSEPNQRMVLIFGVVMVAMIAFLLVLQIGLGQLATEEPQMINLRSLAFSAVISAGLTYAIGNR